MRSCGRAWPPSPPPSPPSGGRGDRSVLYLLLRLVCEELPSRAASPDSFSLLSLSSIYRIPSLTSAVIELCSKNRHSYLRIFVFLELHKTAGTSISFGSFYAKGLQGHRARGKCVPHKVRAQKSVLYTIDKYI